MTGSPLSHHTARLLTATSEGDPQAATDLMPIVYDELRMLARSYLRKEAPGHTLQATSLVHEAYLRIVDRGTATERTRAHFFSVAAQVMRRILVDHARRARAEKRGGEWARLEYNEALFAAEGRSIDLVALDDALTTLEKLDPRQARTVELRFFGGLSLEEAAEVLRVSVSTVRRDWRMAQAWLRQQLSATT